VPYDQLSGISLRASTEHAGTQESTRQNHVYTMAGSIRFSDVFVPGTVTFDSYTTAVGVWRRVMFVGRGIGGKYITALDVTGTGPYTLKASAAGGPIPLWSRGNPDVQFGALGGSNNYAIAVGDAEKTAFEKMGETWSVPVVAYIDRGASGGAIYSTNRQPSPNGPEFVLFVGSGFGEDSGCATNGTPCEGRTFYTLDALSGDVIAAVDVGARGGMPFANAIVASPAGFNPSTYAPLVSVHPAVNKLRRVYVGDVHGILWKFLTADPTQAIKFADLGAAQPIGTPVALLGIGTDPDHPDENAVPWVYATSGADRRLDGPFKIYGFRDEGGDTQTGTTGTESGQTADGGLPARGTCSCRSSNRATRSDLRVHDGGGLPRTVSPPRRSSAPPSRPACATGARPDLLRRTAEPAEAMFAPPTPWRAA
jgi:Tfp pilus tip-associated adhesin PilY1